jgi:hypothetical protein
MTATDFSVCPSLYEGEERRWSLHGSTIAFAKKRRNAQDFDVFNSAAFEFSGIVFVTTICSIPELPRCCAARLEYRMGKAGVNPRRARGFRASETLVSEPPYRTYRR